MTNVDKLRTIFANRMAPAKGLGTIRVAAQHALDSIAIVRMTYMVAERPTIHSTLVRPRTKGTSTPSTSGRPMLRTTLSMSAHRCL
jgi:hypothetical protein